MTIGQNASAAKAVLLAAAVLATPAQAWAGPADTYYERAFVVAADARCGLFDDRVDAALTAANLSALNNTGKPAAVQLQNATFTLPPGT
ncbi:MAG: hypothetical protein RDU12_12050, partial [Brevundimonas sp.]|nr:hypothetical protein [Brevundimonas sp.]